MKAKNLLTGDWLLWKGKPYRISQVDGNNDMGSPMPLTVDILELNGFYRGQPFVQTSTFTNGVTKRFVPYVKMLAGGSVVLTMTYDEAGNCELEFFTPCVSLKINSVRYVHELQHALDICGLDRFVKVEVTKIVDL